MKRFKYFFFTALSFFDALNVKLYLNQRPQGPAKAKKKLNWEPKIRFKELVQMMVDADIKNLEEMKQCQDVIRKIGNNKSRH